MFMQHSLCIVSDDYFSKYGSRYMMDNKHESRPYYFAVKSANGIVWLVPLSSQVDKYQKSIDADESKYGKGKCIFHYVAKVKGKPSAFLIGNAIPATEKYILRSFEICNQPYIVQDKTDIKAINSKLSRFISLVRAGRLAPCIDILAIEKELLSEFTFV